MSQTFFLDEVYLWRNNFGVQYEVLDSRELILKNEKTNEEEIRNGYFGVISFEDHVETYHIDPDQKSLTIIGNDGCRQVINNQVFYYIYLQKCNQDVIEKQNEYLEFVQKELNKEPSCYQSSKKDDYESLNDIINEESELFDNVYQIKTYYTEEEQMELKGNFYEEYYKMYDTGHYKYFIVSKDEVELCQELGLNILDDEFHINNNICISNYESIVENLVNFDKNYKDIFGLVESDDTLYSDMYECLINFNEETINNEELFRLEQQLNNNNVNQKEIELLHQRLTFKPYSKKKENMVYFDNLYSELGIIYYFYFMENDDKGYSQIAFDHFTEYFQYDFKVHKYLREEYKDEAQCYIIDEILLELYFYEIKNYQQNDSINKQQNESINKQQNEIFKMLNTYIKTIDIFTDNDQFNNFVEDKRYLTGIKSNELSHIRNNHKNNEVTDMIFEIFESINEKGLNKIPDEDKYKIINYVIISSFLIKFELHCPVNFKDIYVFIVNEIKYLYLDSYVYDNKITSLENIEKAKELYIRLYKNLIIKEEIITRYKEEVKKCNYDYEENKDIIEENITEINEMIERMKDQKEYLKKVKNESETAMYYKKQSYSNCWYVNTVFGKMYYSSIVNEEESVKDLIKKMYHYANKYIIDNNLFQIEDYNKYTTLYEIVGEGAMEIYDMKEYKASIVTEEVVSNEYEEINYNYMYEENNKVYGIISEDEAFQYIIRDVNAQKEQEIQKQIIQETNHFLFIESENEEIYIKETEEIKDKNKTLVIPIEYSNYNDICTIYYDICGMKIVVPEIGDDEENIKKYIIQNYEEYINELNGFLNTNQMNNYIVNLCFKLHPQYNLAILNEIIMIMIISQENSQEHDNHITDINTFLSEKRTIINSSNDKIIKEYKEIIEFLDMIFFYLFNIKIEKTPTQQVYFELIHKLLGYLFIDIVDDFTNDNYIEFDGKEYSGNWELGLNNLYSHFLSRIFNFDKEKLINYLILFNDEFLEFHGLDNEIEEALNYMQKFNKALIQQELIYYNKIFTYDIVNITLMQPRIEDTIKEELQQYDTNYNDFEYLEEFSKDIDKIENSKYISQNNEIYFEKDIIHGIKYKEYILTTLEFNKNMYKSLGNKFEHLEGINDVGTNNVDYFQKLCKNSFPIGKYNGHNYVVNLLSNDFSFVDSEQKVNNINFYEHEELENDVTMEKKYNKTYIINVEQNYEKNEAMTNNMEELFYFILFDNEKNLGDLKKLQLEVFIYYIFNIQYENIIEMIQILSIEISKNYCDVSYTWDYLNVENCMFMLLVYNYLYYNEKNEKVTLRDIFKKGNDFYKELVSMLLDSKYQLYVSNYIFSGSIEDYYEEFIKLMDIILPVLCVEHKEIYRIYSNDYGVVNPHISYVQMENIEKNIYDHCLFIIKPNDTIIKFEQKQVEEHTMLQKYIIDKKIFMSGDLTTIIYFDNDQVITRNSFDNKEFNEYIEERNLTLFKEINGFLGRIFEDKFLIIYKDNLDNYYEMIIFYNVWEKYFTCENLVFIKLKKLKKHEYLIYDNLNNEEVRFLRNFAIEYKQILLSMYLSNSIFKYDNLLEESHYYKETRFFNYEEKQSKVPPCDYENGFLYSCFFDPFYSDFKENGKKYHFYKLFEDNFVTKDINNKIFENNLLFDIDISDEQKIRSKQLYDDYFVNNNNKAVELVTGYGKSSYVIPYIAEEISQENKKTKNMKLFIVTINNLKDNIIYNLKEKFQENDSVKFVNLKLISNLEYLEKDLLEEMQDFQIKIGNVYTYISRFTSLIEHIEMEDEYGKLIIIVLDYIEIQYLLLMECNYKKTHEHFKDAYFIFDEIDFFYNHSMELEVQLQEENSELKEEIKQAIVEYYGFRGDNLVEKLQLLYSVLKDTTNKKQKELNIEKTESDDSLQELEKIELEKVNSGITEKKKLQDTFVEITENQWENMQIDVNVGYHEFFNEYNEYKCINFDEEIYNNQYIIARPKFKKKIHCNSYFTSIFQTLIFTKQILNLEEEEKKLINISNFINIKDILDFDYIDGKIKNEYDMNIDVFNPQLYTNLEPIFVKYTSDNEDIMNKILLYLLLQLLLQKEENIVYNVNEYDLLIYLENLGVKVMSMSGTSYGPENKESPIPQLIQWEKSEEIVDNFIKQYEYNLFKIPIDIKCYDKNYGSITKFDIIKNQMPLLQENQMPSSKKNNIIFIVDPNGVFFGNEEYGSISEIKTFYEENNHDFILIENTNDEQYIIKDLQEINKRTVIFFSIGTTIGVDIENEHNKVKCIVCFTNIKQGNKTGLKDLIESLGRFRKLGYGKPGFIMYFDEQNKNEQEQKNVNEIQQKLQEQDKIIENIQEEQYEDYSLILEKFKNTHKDNYNTIIANLKNIYDEYYNIDMEYYNDTIHSINYYKAYVRQKKDDQEKNVNIYKRNLKLDVNDHILLDCKLKDKDYLKDSDYLKDNDYNELLKQQQKKHIFDSDKIDISMTDDLKKVDSEINKLFDNTKLNIQMNICTNIENNQQMNKNENVNMNTNKFDFILETKIEEMDEVENRICELPYNSSEKIFNFDIKNLIKEYKSMELYKSELQQNTNMKKIELDIDKLIRF